MTSGVSSRTFRPRRRSIPTTPWTSRMIIRKTALGQSKPQIAHSVFVTLEKQKILAWIGYRTIPSSTIRSCKLQETNRVFAGKTRHSHKTTATSTCNSGRIRQEVQWPNTNVSKRTFYSSTKIPSAWLQLIRRDQDSIWSR